jgi:hypothetical protein
MAGGQDTRDGQPLGGQLLVIFPKLLKNSFVSFIHCRQNFPLLSIKENY